MKARNIKNYLVVTFAVLALALLALGLTACGDSNTDKGASTSQNNSTGGSQEEKLTVLKVGASVTPHAEILNNLKSDLAAQGYDLQVIECTDYIKPNVDTTAGDTAANFFQHQPYLDDYNEKNGTTLVSVAGIHFEPLGIYPGKTASIADLADGARIAVPNDTTNEARALQLLAAQGLITLPAGSGLDVTPKDIVSNPKNLQFLELDAAAVPRALAEVDLGVINGNNALASGLDPKTVLVAEDTKSDAAQTYANIVVVQDGHQNDAGVQALLKLLKSEKTRQFIESNYPGVVIPMF